MVLDEDVLDELVDMLTGTSTTLFQFAEVLPARFLLYISLIKEEMLLNVYVLYVELYEAMKDSLLSGSLFFSKKVKRLS